MLTAIRPNLQAAPASSPRVSSPHAPAPAPAPAQDAVVLSPPAPVEAAAAPERTQTGRKAALVAAGLTAAVLTGVLAPVVGGVLNALPTDVAAQSVTVPVPGGVADPGLSVSGARAPQAPATGPAVAPRAGQTQSDAQPSQPQDPTQLVGQMAVAAEHSAQALPQVGQTHAAWGADLRAMQSTTQDISKHVDALMRDKNKDAAAHHAAIDAGFARLTQQVGDFQARMAREQPGVDQFLGQNRDNLNQLGTISFNLEQNINRAASQYGYFSPQRQALRQLGSEVHKATLDLSMSTEKTSTARADDKALADNMQAVRQIIDQVKKAHDGRQMDQVDNGARVLDNALKVLGNVTQESQKAVDEAAARAHSGASDLVVVYQSMGGGRQAAAQ